MILLSESIFPDPFIFWKLTRWIRANLFPLLFILSQVRWYFCAIFHSSHALAFSFVQFWSLHKRNGLSISSWTLKWRGGKFDLTVLTYLYLISWIQFPLDVTDGRYVFIFSALIAVLHSCTFYDASILYKIYSYVPICINRQVVCVYVQLICLVLYCILLSSSLLFSCLNHSFS